MVAGRAAGVNAMLGPLHEEFGASQLVSFQSFGDLSVTYRMSVTGQGEFELCIACVVTDKVLGCTMIIDSGSESDVVLEEIAALAEVTDGKMRFVQ